MNIALFGRHPSPAEHIVFPEGIPEDKMNDYDYMDSMCVKFFRTKAVFTVVTKGEEPFLYVEGFTPALIAFLKAWDRWFGNNAPTLYLMHYQPDGTYRAQEWTP
tara:strand:+ start:147 stop:458 length:312 start_codon:yes stop_codon:yes gene_type:complete